MATYRRGAFSISSSERRTLLGSINDMTKARDAAVIMLKMIAGDCTQCHGGDCEKCGPDAAEMALVFLKENGYRE